LHQLALDKRLSRDHFPVLMRVINHGENESWRTPLGVIEMMRQGLLDRSHLPALLSAAEAENKSAHNMGEAIAYLSHRTPLGDEDVANIVRVAKGKGRGSQMMLHALSPLMLKGNKAALEGMIEIAQGDNVHTARPALFMLRKLIESVPEKVDDKYMSTIKSAIDKHKESEPVFFQLTPSSMMKV
jgi:hypothetical protein